MHHRHIIGRDKPLLCRHTANLESDWFSNDSVERYNKNMELGLLDPVYNDLAYVHYKFNSYGYRTVEFDTYNDNEFFLAMGCSYTVGEGLASQDRWSDRLTELSGIPNINMGISGSGLDTHMINSIHWTASNLPKPKFVVVQQPEVTRFQTWNTEELDSDLIFSEICDDSQDRLDKLLHQLTRQLKPGDDRRVITEPVNVAYQTEIMNFYWSTLGIPVYHWTFTGDADVVKNFTQVPIHSYPGDFSEIVDRWPGDCARDCAHDGIHNNKLVAELLYKHIKSEMTL